MRRIVLSVALAVATLVGVAYPASAASAFVAKGMGGKACVLNLQLWQGAGKFDVTSYETLSSGCDKTHANILKLTSINTQGGVATTTTERGSSYLDNLKISGASGTYKSSWTWVYFGATDHCVIYWHTAGKNIEVAKSWYGITSSSTCMNKS